MYRHILVATDGSDLAMRAVTLGAGLAKALGARLGIVIVMTPYASVGDSEHAFAGMPDSVRAQALAYLQGEARKALDAAKAEAARAGVAAETILDEHVHADAGILAAAKRWGADLVVVASHGRSGVKALLIGSVTQKVLAKATVPVLVAR